MTAIFKRNALAALLLILCLVVSFSTVSVSAEDETDASETALETTAVSETAPETTAETDAESDVGTTDGTEAAADAGFESATEAVEAGTEAATNAPIDKTKGIINISVGAVILVALIVLAIIFRAKIPAWYRSIKSECGKIVWCPADKLKKNTVVVVIIILAITVLIGVLDYAFSEGLLLLGKLF